MEIDDQDVKKIARLAGLHIDPQEISDMRGHLSSIFDLVEQMNQVENADVEPMAHPLDIVQRLRADMVAEEDQREKYQDLAPQTADNLYLVPKVIDN